MIIIKGWRDNKDMCIVSKAHEHIAAETAVEMINAAKDGPAEGKIRLPGGKMLEYNRYSNGRIMSCAYLSSLSPGKDASVPLIKFSCQMQMFLDPEKTADDVVQS